MKDVVDQGAQARSTVKDQVERFAAAVNKEQARLTRDAVAIEVMTKIIEAIGRGAGQSAVWDLVHSQSTGKKIVDQAFKMADRFSTLSQLDVGEASKEELPPLPDDIPF